MNETETREELKRFAARLTSHAEDPERDVETIFAASIEILRLYQAEYMLAQQRETTRAIN